jgi:hypothetical protein
MIMNSSAHQQMIRLAAIFAVVLLCTQTFVVAHEHDPLDDTVCAICTTATVIAAPTEPPSLAVQPISRFQPTARGRSADAQIRPSRHLARAPPTA